MKVDEALEVSRRSIDDLVHWRQIQVDALRVLGEEVKRLREQPRPRSMESAPKGGDEISLVMRAMYVRGMGWVVDREAKPVGWLSATESTTTDEQVSQPKSVDIDEVNLNGVTTTDEQVGE